AAPGPPRPAARCPRPPASRSDRSPTPSRPRSASYVAPHQNPCYVAPHNTRQSLPDYQQETTMNQYNEQFANATRQFADAAAEASRLALANAQDIFGLQLAAVEKNATATFAYLGELAEVRDAEGLKAVLPKGVQVARENVERAISVGQEVVGRTIKANE